MTEHEPEKRRYGRVIFKDPKQIAALISPFESGTAEEAVPAAILNMSEGGMQISVERNALTGIRRGRKIILHCISGLPEITCFTDVPMQVVWMMDNDYLDHVLLGVAFDQLSPQQKDCLRTSVDICLRLQH
jgi:c-di-GMP-binding flagellar brake protein YcgR